jgi:hypothetical protein
MHLLFVLREAEDYEGTAPDDAVKVNVKTRFD